ncbi:ATPase, T2SS/T4P/T4SS family [Paraburkholderia sp. A3BS-1L]|uniref:ATPase, T2SS/T4P/T4SS family n=1 Tax=Paraburkholderia sp. A3BS-1L TaxID=3028375 RepID=UPI003DA8DE2B
MSLFGSADSNEKPRAGVLARLRGWRGGFVEESDSAPVEPAFTRHREAKKGPGAPPGSLGARLRDAEVMDVEARESPDAIPPRTSQVERDELQTPVGGSPDFASADRAEPETAAATPSEHVGPLDDEVPASRDTDAMREKASPADADFVVSSNGEAFDVRTRRDCEPDAGPATSREVGDSSPHLSRTQDDDSAGTALAVSDVEYTPVGIPRLLSAEALVDFKRILCDTTPDVTLRISAEARLRFVAVDMQAGMAVVIATCEFHQSALYSTYLQDLERAHVAVREEMIAAEDVIAGIYERARIRLSKNVSEGSRAIALFRDVMEAARGYDASDAHWESREYQSDAELRFRVDGDLYTFRRMRKETVLRALSAAYQDLVQRNTNSGNAFQPTAPQSAMIPLALATDTVNLRWQSAPQVNGFDVALRLLDGNFRNYTVRMPQTMGLEASQLRIVDSLGHASGGAVLLSGETGSAKTTLLRALAYMVDGRELKKQYAVSLPSEYPMPWLSDQSITRGLDETEEEFRRKVVTVIRTLMRMDPDDLTVAEILDSAVAGLVVELALTGHPVRTTIHADSIIGVFMRLMGDRLQLTADEVASEKFVNAVGNQKLIPLLCPHCKRPAADVMPAAKLDLLRTKFGMDVSQMACRDDNGCEHCRKKGLLARDGKVAGGTKGQTLAMELYRPTPAFLDRIAMRDWRGAETAWRSERATGFGDADMTGKTIYEHALYKASQGLIDPRFIDLSMRPFDVYRVMPDRDGRMPS